MKSLIFRRLFQRLVNIRKDGNMSEIRLDLWSEKINILKCLWIKHKFRFNREEEK